MKRRYRKRDSTRLYEFDVCLSFAGEDRVYVRKVADELRRCGTRVFFDEYAQADMWGKDLYTHLDDLYQNAARFCVLFASKHYARKVWTNHERESAQARAIRQHTEYILPARFDSIQIPGLRPTVGYIDLRHMRPSQLAHLVMQKIGDRQKEDYFPPTPDRIFQNLKLRSANAREKAHLRAYDFFKASTRMNRDERKAVVTILLHGCPTELPDNMHINLDLLRRLTGFVPGKLLRLLSGLGSLGFYVGLRDEEGNTDDLASQAKLVALEWHDMTTNEKLAGNATREASAAISAAASGLCEECAIDHLLRLDFSQLARVTSEYDDNHL
jgi:TIR domain-containing protein